MMTKNKNFFSVLFSICSGTKIFTKIIDFGLLKAIWHLTILAFICSMVFTVVNAPQVNKEVSMASDFFQNEFGDIVVKNNGIYPQKDPKKQRNINYNCLQVNYFPSADNLKDLKINSSLNYSGFIWTPDNVTGWIKFSRDDVLLYPAVTNLTSTRLFRICPRRNVAAYIHNNRITDFNNLVFRLCAQGTALPVIGVFVLRPSNNFNQFTNEIFHWSLAIIFFRFFIAVLIYAILYSLIFAAVYRFTGGKMMSTMKFKQFFSVAIYAGFPGIIIGTLFELAQLPWLQYQTVFIIAFVVYLIVVANRLRQTIT